MKKKPILALTGMTMAGLMALTACGGGGGNSGGGNGGGGSSDPSVTRNVDAKTEEGGTMYQLLNAPYSHLDPAQGFDGGVNNFYRLIYRQLTTVGGGGASTSTSRAFSPGNRPGTADGSARRS